MVPCALTSLYPHFPFTAVCALHRFLFFFFNDTATPEISPLSLHDALPISSGASNTPCRSTRAAFGSRASTRASGPTRSEEHTSELQSPDHLVCRLLLEKKNMSTTINCMSLWFTDRQNSPWSQL